MGEIVRAKHPRWRVRIEVDLQAEKPYDDGSSPLLRFDTGVSAWRCTQEKDVTSYRVPDEVLRAGERWGPTATFERYLRIFHGATSFEDYATADADYLTFDTAHWREAMGLTDEYLAAHPEVRGTLANLVEWRAYCEGEVYSYVVEQLETWQAKADPSRVRDLWEPVESCGGFYGYDAARVAAEDALNACVESDGVVFVSLEIGDELPLIALDAPVDFAGVLDGRAVKVRFVRKPEASGGVSPLAMVHTEKAKGAGS